MIIGVLLAVLVVQYVANMSNVDRFIDPITCEIYTQGAPGAVGKQYIGEFDQKCMDLKEMLP